MSETGEKYDIDTDAILYPRGEAFDVAAVGAAQTPWWTRTLCAVNAGFAEAWRSRANGGLVWKPLLPGATAAAQRDRRMAGLDGVAVLVGDRERPAHEQRPVAIRGDGRLVHGLRLPTGGAPQAPRLLGSTGE